MFRLFIWHSNQNRLEFETKLQKYPENSMLLLAIKNGKLIHKIT